MKKRSLIYLFIAIITAVSIMFTGCSGKATNDSSPAMPQESIAEEGRGISGAAPAVPGAAAPDRKLIVRLYMELRVDNIEKGIGDAEKMAASVGGYTRESYQREASGQLTLMIPADRVAEFTEGLKGLGKVINSNRKTEDVTDSYFDTQVRIRNLEAELETLRGLLQKPGWKVSEILEIEREIRRLTDELETLKGYLTNLDRQISYSEVQISFSQNQAVIDNKSRDSLGYKLTLSLKDGTDFMIGAVTAILSLIVFLLPVSPIIAILYFVFRKPLSRFKRKSKKGTVTESLKDPKQE